MPLALRHCPQDLAHPRGSSEIPAGSWRNALQATVKGADSLGLLMPSLKLSQGKRQHSGGDTHGPSTAVWGQFTVLWPAHMLLFPVRWELNEEQVAVAAWVPGSHPENSRGCLYVHTVGKSHLEGPCLILLCLSVLLSEGTTIKTFPAVTTNTK